MYQEKAFNNTKRCLLEAIKQNDSLQYRMCKLENPNTNLLEHVMLPEYAICWSIENHLPYWRQNTWRIYRNSYRYLLEQLLSSGLIHKEEVEKLIDLMLKASASKQKVRRTSGMRKKSISEDDYIKLIEECDAKCSSPKIKEQTKYTWGSALKVFIISSVATGLRPNEWRTAEIIQDGSRFLLKCENFKYNEERSYAKYRTIDLSNITEDKKLAIKQHHAIVVGFAKNGTDNYQMCRSLLSRLNKKLWPSREKQITLYTGRHQFSANAKASTSTTDAERAAMMGHKTTRTSRERYGRRRAGANGLTPKIANDAVLLMIQQPQIKLKKNNVDQECSFVPKNRK
jgi:integrase